ncbi:hypothetical protein OXX59_007907 [Metschnikowia pulcherrima]
MCVLTLFRLGIVFTCILQLAACMTEDSTKQESDSEYESDSDSYVSCTNTDLSEFIKFHEDHPDASTSFSQELETNESSLNHLEQLWKDLKELADKDQTFACLFETLLDEYTKSTGTEQSGDTFTRPRAASAYHSVRAFPTISPDEKLHHIMDVVVIDDSETETADEAD